MANVPTPVVVSIMRTVLPPLNVTLCPLPSIVVGTAMDRLDATVITPLQSNVTVPPPPVQYLTGGFSNSIWQAQFLSRSNWLYTLERSEDLEAWTALPPGLTGTGRASGSSARPWGGSATSPGSRAACPSGWG